MVEGMLIQMASKGQLGGKVGSFCRNLIAVSKIEFLFHKVFLTSLLFVRPICQ